jgi:hypothetical protein
VSPQKHLGKLSDVVAVLGTTLFVSFFSGANKFTGLYTPDSEFYASLGAFGNEVTDRAPFPAYYWTRLTLTGPLGVLNSLFDPETSWALYRSTLIGLFVTCFYILLRRFDVDRSLAAGLSAVFSLNSVILYFVGDPYVTGTVMALTMCLLTIVSGIETAHNRWHLRGLACGGIASAIFVTNPNGFIIASLASLGFLTGDVLSKKISLRKIMELLCLSAVGFVAFFGLVLTANQLWFPDLNWIETVRYYSAILKGSHYASQDVWLWLKSETSLIVVFLVLLFLGLNLFKRRLSWGAATPLLVAGLACLYPLVLVMLNPTPALEASFYSAMLWPPTLIAFLSSGSEDVSRLTPTQVTKSLIFTLIAVLTLIVIGHTQSILPVTNVLVIAPVTAVAMALWIMVRVGGRPGQTFMFSLIMLVVFQVLQNARPATEGVIQRNSYSLAFRQSAAEDQVLQGLEAENWLLTQTSPTEKVQVYAEGGTGTVSPSAFQLWGPNAVGTDPEVTEYTRANLQNVRPSAVVTYFRVRNGYRETRQEFMGSLLDEVVDDPQPQCRVFKRRGEIAPLEVCIYRILW